MSFFLESASTHSLFVDGPWWSLLLIKLTCLLAFAWLIHFALFRSNPRWRVVLWRTTTVATVTVALLAILPWNSLTISIQAPQRPVSPASDFNETTRALVVQDMITNDQPHRGHRSLVANPEGIAFSPAPIDDTTSRVTAAPTEVNIDDAETARFVTPALLRWAAAIIWCAGLLVLAIRSVAGRRRLNDWITTSTAAESWIVDESNRIARSMNVANCSLRTINADVSPLLCMSKTGPVLLLPIPILATADRDEVTAILTHELSHLRSNDLRWNAVIRCVTAVLWPHPLVWKLASAHTTACEYSADADSARRLGDADLYRRTLAKVALATSSHRVPGLAMARVADVRRRLEFVAKTIFSVPLTRHQITTFGFSAMLLTLSIGSLKFVNADPPPTPKTSSSNDQTATTDTTADTAAAKSIVIRLTDPAGQPLEDGKVVAKIANSLNKRTTLDPIPLEDGSVRFDLPAEPGYLLVEAKAVGHVPMKAIWQVDEWDTLPKEFTFPMQLGTTISGRVQDEQGRGIENAEVQILASTSELRNARPRTDVYRYPVKTDKDGRWICKVVPAQLNAVWLRFVHPDYISDDMFGQTANNISIDQLRAGSLISVLKKGTTVEGKVVDSDGQPISGAVVYQGKDRFGSSYPETTTDENGIFTFPNSRLDEMVLTIVAKGYAPETQTVNVTAAMEPVEIALKPGNRLRVRTVDADGQPLADVMVVPDTWRGFRSLADAKIPRKSNKNGIYVWNDAPADVIEFDILARGYMDHRREKLTARADEYVIKMVPPLRVHGTVTDAVTGNPINQFKVVQGIKWNEGDNVTWQLQDAVKGQNGQYEIKTTYPRPGHLFRFDAVGYKSVISPVFKSDQGDVLHNVAMQPAAAISGQVSLPSGDPAVGAQVILNVAGQYVAIQNGRFSDARDAVFATTDAAGKFELPTPEQEFRLLAIHDAGMIEMTGKDFDGNENLVLKPWASIRGEVKTGSTAASQVSVRLHHLSQIPYQQPKFSFSGQTITDENGRYELLRVPPGENVQLSRATAVDATGRQLFTRSVRIATQPATEHVVDFGGTGRPITGRVDVPDDITEFRIDHGTLSPKLPEPPIPEDVANGTLEQRQQWLTEWSTTEAGKRYMAKATQNIAFVMADDRSFRIEDVPAGTYTLSLTAIAAKATETLNQGEQLGFVRTEVVVPEMSGGRSDEPLDLGSIKLKPRVFLRVGDMAPELKIKTLDGRPLSLADYRGKYVLLDFWATWCGPCLAEIPNLKKVHENFDDDKLVILSVSIDAKSKDAVNYIDENPLPWPQGHVDEENQPTVMTDFDFQSIPATFVIDPQGKIIAKDIRGEDLAEKIAKLRK